MGESTTKQVVIPSAPLLLGYSFVPGTGPIQNPFAIVLGRAHARAPVETIFDRSVNKLFTIRVAGNVPGAEYLGSIEHAVRYIAGGLRLVVVPGHSGCVAVEAAIEL